MADLKTALRGAGVERLHGNCHLPTLGALERRSLHWRGIGKGRHRIDLYVAGIGPDGLPPSDDDYPYREACPGEVGPLLDALEGFRAVTLLSGDFLRAEGSLAHCE